MVFVLLLVIAVVAFGICQWAVGKHAAMMAKGARVNAPTAHTAAEVATLYLRHEGINDVEVVEHDSVVTDYYDAKRRRLFLRGNVARGTDLAAWAVALHEAAHALPQDDPSVGELFHRRTCIAFCRYWPMVTLLALGGLIIAGRLPPRMAILVGAAVMGGLAAWNLGTVSIEFAANRRLSKFLDRHLQRHAQAHDRLKELLFSMAIREVGDMLRSPRYFFLSALPGAGKARPG